MGTSLSFKRERCGGGTPFRVARRSLPVGSSAVPAAGVCQRLTPPQRKGPGRAAADPGEFPAASERDGGRQNYRDASSRPPEGKIRSPHAPPLPRPAGEAAVPSGGSPSAPPPPQPAATAASLPHLPTSSLLRGEEQLVHFPVWARGNIRARYSARFVTDPVPRLPRERGPVGPR